MLFPIASLSALVQMAQHQFFFELHRVREKCGLGENTNDVKVTCIPYLITRVPQESPMTQLEKLVTDLHKIWIPTQGKSRESSLY